MRRLVPLAAFAICLVLPLWAQHGGGHAASGHGGFSASGGHVSSGMRSASGSSRGFSRAPSSFSQPFSRRSFLTPGLSNRPFLHDGFRGSRLRGFRPNCFGYPCRGYGYPWLYGAYYDPYGWGDSGSSYDDDYAQDRATANDMNQQSIEEQQMLRQEQADGDRDAYARSLRVPGNEPQGTTIMPATVLVFRDQHQKEIQNYAIVGQTLWNFAPQHTEKISLSDLDLAATAKANDERGLTFRVPGSNEAQ
ncbi:MAG TPA: hypothetical protein VIH75_18335 [Candidatus Sulfotelmatobacter sp.]|jgi:hypothetical protein